MAYPSLHIPFAASSVRSKSIKSATFELNKQYQKLLKTIIARQISGWAISPAEADHLEHHQQQRRWSSKPVTYRHWLKPRGTGNCYQLAPFPIQQKVTLVMGRDSERLGETRREGERPSAAGLFGSTQQPGILLRKE